MTNCTQESFQFPVLKRRIVEANFQGGDITSDGGVLLLQQVDRRLGLSEAVARTLDDPRRQASIDHNSLKPATTAGLCPGPGLRRPQRPRDPAPGPGHPNGTGAHRGTGQPVRPCAAGRTGPTGKLPGACMKSSSSNSLLLLKQRRRN